MSVFRTGDSLEGLYDPHSVQSILDFAKRLNGKSLAEVEFIPHEIANVKNKGDLGSLVETFYFRHTPGSFRGPDFREAGLELKTTGVIPTKGGLYKAKERLVLTMINYEEIAKEVWETSTFLSKCSLMLVLFYLFEAERPVVDRRFVLDPYLFQLEKHDLEIIKHDWETIRAKVLEGKAHELSEGDTYYLAACRKGSGGMGEALRKQPFSDIGAPARAFSFKPKFVTSWIQNIDKSRPISFELITDFGGFIADKFAPFTGETVGEIAEKIGASPRQSASKIFHRQLAVGMLRAGGGSIDELNKAEIEMKTIRLKSSGAPRESMSFPSFTFLELEKQTWSDSSFYAKLEKKFLFVVFRQDSDGVERFIGVKIWNMPYGDRLEAQRVWEDTKRRASIDARDLPKISESQVAHVRPKGRNGDDKILTLQGTLHLRQAFWLNASYIASIFR